MRQKTGNREKNRFTNGVRGANNLGNPGLTHVPTLDKQITKSNNDRLLLSYRYFAIPCFLREWQYEAKSIWLFSRVQYSFAANFTPHCRYN